LCRHGIVYSTYLGGSEDENRAPLWEDIVDLLERCLQNPGSNHHPVAANLLHCPGGGTCSSGARWGPTETFTEPSDRRPVSAAAPRIAIRSGPTSVRIGRTPGKLE